MSELSAFLIGSCEPFRRFLDELAALSASDATVLLEGESGVGKGAAAKALHGTGNRAEGPLGVVSLAALAPNLIESALFGHERGAFTGAERARQGLFRQSDRGTVVLDDVDLLPLEAQVKLLRVLQERVVEPLGSEEAVPIDVRVVATTNRDLRREAAEGRFREDLYYRLAVVTLRVPPLRARREDLPELVQHLSQRVAQRLGCPVRPLSGPAQTRLEAHPWPGNVRELENALERVHVLSGAGPIEAGELEFLDEAVRGAAHDLARNALAAGLEVDDVTLAMMEVALDEERGNVSAAARRVGLTRRAFDYRLSRSPTAESAAGETP